MLECPNLTKTVVDIVRTITTCQTTETLTYRVQLKTGHISNTIQSKFYLVPNRLIFLISLSKFYRYRPFIPHVVFDLILNETAFPRVRPIPANEDKLLNEVNFILKPVVFIKCMLSFVLKAIMKRNLDMSPNSNDNAQLLNLINKIQTILDNLVVSPGDFDACVCI
jgi:hypothetical protein